MKIYTKTGDRGETGLIGGVRTSKDDFRIEALGELDELNAALGLARVALVGDPLDRFIAGIQSVVFDVGAGVAQPDGKEADTEPQREHCRRLETSIDEMTASLEPLKQFILPGGGEAGARLHLARAVCRRAERTLVRLHRESPVAAESLEFINRLSDWLFVAARAANANQGVQDVRWSQSRH